MSNYVVDWHQNPLKLALGYEVVGWALSGHFGHVRSAVSLAAIL